MITFQESIQSHEQTQDARDALSGRMCNGKPIIWDINISKMSRKEQNKFLRDLFQKYKQKYSKETI